MYCFLLEIMILARHRLFQIGETRERTSKENQWTWVEIGRLLKDCPSSREWLELTVGVTERRPGREQHLDGV